MPLIRRSALLLTIAAVCLTTSARAQTGRAAASRDSDKAATIRQILSMTHAADQAIAAMETAMPAQRAANPNIPAVFWDRFMKQARARRAELEDEIMAVYDRHFSGEEMHQLLAFYQTPIGKKLVSTQPAVMQESILAGQKWGQKIGMEVGQQLASEGVKAP